MGARGGISTLLLLLLVVCQPQSLHAGPPAGGKPRPASPPEGWSGEKSGGMMLGFGWAGRDGDPAASGMGTHGCRLSLPELRGGPVAKLAGGRRGSCLFSGRVFGPGRPAGKGEGGSGAARLRGSQGAAYPGCVRRFPWGGERTNAVLGGTGLPPRTHAGTPGLWSAPWAAHGGKSTFPALPKPCAMGTEHGHVLAAPAGRVSPPCPCLALDGAGGKVGAGQHLPGCVSPPASALSVCPGHPGVAGCMGQGARLSCRHSPGGVQDHPTGDGAPGTIQS